MCYLSILILLIIAFYKIVATKTLFEQEKKGKPPNGNVSKILLICYLYLNLFLVE